MDMADYHVHCLLENVSITDTGTVTTRGLGTSLAVLGFPPAVDDGSLSVLSVLTIILCLLVLTICCNEGQYFVELENVQYLKLIYSCQENRFAER